MQPSTGVALARLSYRPTLHVWALHYIVGAVNICALSACANQTLVGSNDNYIRTVARVLVADAARCRLNTKRM